MNNDAFHTPVTVLVGMGFPRTIATVGHAIAYLQDVPGVLRDAAHEATLDACRDALTERCSAQEAHDVFVAYARRRSILVEEPLAAAAMKAKDDLLGASTKRAVS